MSRVRRATRGGVAAGLLAIGLGTGAPSGAQEAPMQAPSPEPAPAAPMRPAPARPRPAAAPAEEPPKPTEQAWVGGQVKVNFRASASPKSTPIGVVVTGQPVGVIERRGGWARVLVGESQVGWLPETTLEPTPPPREHVALLQTQVAELRAKLDDVEREAETLRTQMGELTGKDAEREEAMRRLREENRDLRAGERWPYLVTGAGILGIGITVGRFLRGGARRSYSRLRY